MNKIYYLLEGLVTGRISLKKLPDVYKRYKELKGFQKLQAPFVETEYGTKMYLNSEDWVVSKELYYKKCWEREETEFFKKIILNGMNIIDIGANIGYFSILFSKWVGDKGKVFAFEPDPENFRFLVKNIQANICHNIIPINKAVSNNDGKIFLFQSATNKGDHRIIDAKIIPEDVIRNKIEIEATRLDSSFSPEQKIDLIKMDIQGAEGLALEGMTQILSRNHKMYLFTEFWPYAIERSGKSPKEFLEQLNQLGFKIATINKNEKIPTSNSDFGEKPPNWQINLICERQEK